MQPYPKNINDKTVVPSLNQVVRLRDQDIQDRNNFPNVFVSGRSVNRTPSSSSDVIGTDRVGDVSFDPAGTYVYYCLNVSGTIVWRRIALASW